MTRRIVLKNLSAEAKGLFKKIVNDFQFDPDDTAGLMVLRAALEAFDRMRQAQAAIAEHGVTFMDRYGQPRVNPAASVERDSRAAMLACFKNLGLDLTVIDDRPPGRPPGR